MTSALQHHTFDVNGIKLHYVTQGKGPLVIMCHGYPGLWYSWRHQLGAIADAGYTALAIDQRGYGRSDRPREVALYDSNQQCADLISLLDHLNTEKAIFIGHDFGAAQVYNLAIRHPQRVAAVVGVACPYDFDLAGRGCAGSSPPANIDYHRAFARPDKKPSECFAEVAKNHFYHMHYFQKVGPAEKELAAQPRLFLESLFWALSADGNLLDWTNYSAKDHGYLDVLAKPEPLPWSWLSKADIDYYLEQFTNCDAESEFIGGLNSYRVADRNWEIGLEYADHSIKQPSLFIAGAEDVVLQMIGTDALNMLKKRSYDLRGINIINAAGHFVQQEQPEAFNKALIAFLQSL
jgi:pimeloyl-ACP methyl ester carboxylesterase